MKCPVCDDVKMREIEKDDVLIDVCPQCKGVWLDRGELEKLLLGVREVQAEYERLEQQAQGYAEPSRQTMSNQQPGGHPHQPGPPPGGGQSAAAGYGNSGAGGQATGYGSQGAGYGNPGAAGQAPIYGGQNTGYGNSGQPPGHAGQGAGYGNQHPAPGYGNQTPPPGYGQPPVGYGSQGNYGQPGPYGHQGGYGQHGYDKYGRPYKRKKNMLDVLGDLFD